MNLRTAAATALALAATVTLGVLPAGALPTRPVDSGRAANSAPTAGSTRAADSASPAFRIAAVADIACDPASPAFHSGQGSGQLCRARAVADRISAYAPDLVVIPGDLQYDSGTLAAFRASFGVAYAGLRDRVRAVPGNHEWRTPDAAGFRAFFADTQAVRRTWLAFDAGPWQVLGLDSNCTEVGGCGSRSPQGRWLAHQLATSTTRCTLAFWHHPRRSSGPHGDEVTAGVRHLWQTVREGGVDIVLNGHDHLYERFATRGGVRAFTVGAGGKDHYWIERRQPESRFIDTTHFGALILDLRPAGYDWRFVGMGGRILDSGTASCT